MMYEFKCMKCEKTHYLSCHISEYDDLKAKLLCCGETPEPVITGGVSIFTRAPFPKGYEITEHCCDEPTFCKDKAHLRDLCAESSSVSRFIEDDM